MEAKRNTKELILLCALRLFAEKGYSGVSVRDIAKEVGVRESALYKHYKNKQDIFDSVQEEMTNRFNEAVVKVGMPSGNPKEVVDYYTQANIDVLTKISTGVFLFYLKDEFASLFRRMLMIEQFSNTAAGLAFKEIFIENALNFQSELFALLIERGEFKKADPKIMALHFYSPIFLMLSQYDGAPVQKEEEALQQIKHHVEQFANIYSKEE